MRFQTCEMRLLERSESTYLWFHAGNGGITSENTKNVAKCIPKVVVVGRGVEVVG